MFMGFILGFYVVKWRSTASRVSLGLLLALYSRFIKTPEDSLLDDVIGMMVFFVLRIVNKSPIPKFISPDCIRIIITGSTAGKFSSFCPGFGVGPPGTPTFKLSTGVKRRVDPALPHHAKPCPPNLKAERVFLDPTMDLKVTQIPLTKRSGKIEGAVAFLDISKPGGNQLFDRLQMLMKKKNPSVEIQRFVKPTFSRPAPDDVRQKIMNACKHVVVALAD